VPRVRSSHSKPVWPLRTAQSGGRNATPFMSAVARAATSGRRRRSLLARRGSRPRVPLARGSSSALTPLQPRRNMRTRTANTRAASFAVASLQGRQRWFRAGMHPHHGESSAAVGHLQRRCPFSSAAGAPRTWTPALASGRMRARERGASSPGPVDTRPDQRPAVGDQRVSRPGRRRALHSSWRGLRGEVSVASNGRSRSQGSARSTPAFEHAFLAEYWEAETELTRRRGSAGREHTDLRRAMSA
jgi:hypothetical protein